VDVARRPVLVGVGQITLRDRSWPDIVGPLDLLCEAVTRAVADTGAAVVDQVDHLCVANIASWDYGDAPALAAARLGFDERAELVELPVGGNTPQRAVLLVPRARTGRTRDPPPSPWADSAV
jgi:acetyl-CoA C-acetyltransferase